MIHVPQEQAEFPKKTPPRIRYTERERADALTALYANGGNVTGTARQLGIPRATLDLWAGGTGQRTAALPVEVREERLAPLAVREASKRDYLKELEGARWLYLDRLKQPDAVEKTSGYYAAVTTKILTEQHQLLSGGATSRTELSLASFLGSVVEALPAGGGEKSNPELGVGEGTQVLVSNDVHAVEQRTK